MNAYSSIIKGLKEAIDHEKGGLKGVKRHVVAVKPLIIYKDKEIKNIRAKLDLTQSAFANIIGVSQKAVEKWESGKNIPQGPAQRMLELLDKEPAITEKYLIPK